MPPGVERLPPELGRHSLGGQARSPEVGRNALEAERDALGVERDPLKVERTTLELERQLPRSSKTCRELSGRRRGFTDHLKLIKLLTRS